MEFLFDNNSPIYLQMADILIRQIASGSPAPGDKLPSVRELAATARVNPNTVQKALTELEEMGLIYTERTNGKFVTHDSSLIDECRRSLALKLARAYLSDMEALGFSKEEAEEQLKFTE